LKKEKNRNKEIIYTEEEKTVYEWAKESGITTINTIDESRIQEPLTRAELAKIVSVFAKNVL